MGSTNSTSSRSPLRLKKKSGTENKGCVVAFLSLFMLLGLVFLTWIVLFPVYNIMRSRNWQETPCTITLSEVETHDGDGDTYSIHIEYDYAANGRPQHGTRYDFTLGSDNFRRAKEEIVAAHPVGSKSVCFVNPSDPTESVMSRSTGTMIWFGLLPLALIVIPGAVIVAVLRGVGSGAATSAGKGDQLPHREWLPQAPRGIADHSADELSATTAGSSPWTASPAYAADPNAPSGEVTLRPSASPLGTLLGTIFICLFWNGIVSVFLWQAVESFRRGSPSWFMVVFLTPFVLVGVFLVFAVFHSLLALFNPRPTLRLSGAAVRLGDRLLVGWRFSGSTWRVRSLKITLQGEESATYRRGTSTYTDRSVFAKIPVIETEQSFDIPSGANEIQIPVDTMHSFGGANNKITWTISLRADIPWWPDVAASFPIVLLPLSAEARKS